MLARILHARALIGVGPIETMRTLLPCTLRGNVSDGSARDIVIVIEALLLVSGT
jgi:hypothetical protein